jgi:5'-3' exonuclease
MRFPDLYRHMEGDVDRVAARVAWEYLEGMNWVLRYYACGPAAVSWRQQQPAAGSSGSSAEVPGASWSWCYKYHYAPLMQVCL